MSTLRARARNVSDALQRRIAPGLEYSQHQYEAHLREHVARADRWLDLGCGHQLLPDWRSEAEDALIASCPGVVGLDYEFDALVRHRSIRMRCRGDASALPFGDAVFDLVTANMVVEHLTDPARQFTEICRVLRPGGTFLFHTPNWSGYPVQVARRLPEFSKRWLVRLLEGRSAEDVFRTHYLANSTTAIADAAAQSGLQVVGIHFLASTPATGIIPPLAFIELLWLRQLLRRPRLARFRQTLVGALRRPPIGAGEHETPRDSGVSAYG